MGGYKGDRDAVPALKIPTKKEKYKAAFSQTATDTHVQSACGRVQRKKGRLRRGCLGERLCGVSFDLGLDEWI